MTKIKLCGLMSPGDIEAVNALMPEYAGFVFAQKSRRYVSPRQAAVLRKMLNPDITAVGVFVDEEIGTIEALLADDVIDAVQLHGKEDEAYIDRLRKVTGRLGNAAERLSGITGKSGSITCRRRSDAGSCDKRGGIPIIKAFRIDSEDDIARAEESTADHVLLDAGSGGTGTSFDWELLSEIRRPYFLAGGLDAVTVKEALKRWRPYGVDVSSGIETHGRKDPAKMRVFVMAVRNFDDRSSQTGAVDMADYS